MLSLFSGSAVPKAPVVPVINLKGVIKSGGSTSFPSTAQPLNFDGVRKKLVDAFNTAGAVAVALDINSPGGSPAQSELIGQLIRQLAEEKHIPVYAFAQDVAASGGYWLACAADEIYAARTSVIGSIGVVNEGYGYKGLFEKLGLETRVFTAGENKRRLNPAEEVKDEDRQWMRGRLEKIHSIFKDWILERRGDRLKVPEGEDVTSYLDKNVFTGETWYGDEAVENGLIDGVGYMEPVLREKFGQNVVIKLPQPERKGLLSMLMPFGRASTGAEAAGAVGAAAVQAAVDVLKEEAGWAPYKLSM